MSSYLEFGVLRVFSNELKNSPSCMSAFGLSALLLSSSIGRMAQVKWLRPKPPPPAWRPLELLICEWCEKMGCHSWVRGRKPLLSLPKAQAMAASAHLAFMNPQESKVVGGAGCQQQG